jgi:hypothetical protein
MANIQKRGDTYTFRVSAGYDANGKQVIKTMTWKPPAGMNKRRADKEARHEAELFEEKVRNGMVGDGRMKLADFAKKMDGRLRRASASSPDGCPVSHYAGRQDSSDAGVYVSGQNLSRPSD